MKTEKEKEIVERLNNSTSIDSQLFYFNKVKGMILAEGIKVGKEQGEIIGRLLCANESHKELEEESKAEGRKQCIEGILIDSRLNSQINEAGIRLILKEKLQKEAEK